MQRMEIPSQSRIPCRGAVAIGRDAHFSWADPAIPSPGGHTCWAEFPEAVFSKRSGATGHSGLRTPRPVGSTQEGSCARVVAGTLHEPIAPQGGTSSTQTTPPRVWMPPQSHNVYVRGRREIYGLFYLNVAPTKPWSPCKPHTARQPRNQAAAKACRSSS